MNIVRRRVSFEGALNKVFNIDALAHIVLAPLNEPTPTGIFSTWKTLIKPVTSIALRALLVEILDPAELNGETKE